MHIKMLNSMLHGTLHFFDSTPTGRIVNRFTKDIEATEDSIPQSIKILVECLLSMISTIFVISTTTPLFLFGLVPVMAFYVFVQVSRKKERKYNNRVIIQAYKWKFFEYRIRTL